MNKLIIFTDSIIPVKQLAAFEESKKWELIPLPHAQFRRKLKNPDSETIYLFDYASSCDENKTKDLKYLLKKQDAPRGVIDRKNEIIDPAELLINRCDYISGKLLKTGIKPQRVIKYVNFPYINTPKQSTPEKESTIITADGWTNIKSGKEYSFLMLFAEITISSEWKKKSGSVHLNKVKQDFQTVVEKTITPYDGKIWIWNESGGLILFPFDGTSTSAVVPAIKLLLNRIIFSVEDFDLHMPINLKAAMHLGTTTWRTRGKTGKIISDSLNSIFHLGTKYTPLNDFDITEEVYVRLIPGLKKLFFEAGSFEGRNIYRLCHLEVEE